MAFNLYSLIPPIFVWLLFSHFFEIPVGSYHAATHSKKKPPLPAPEIQLLEANSPQEVPTNNIIPLFRSSSGSDRVKVQSTKMPKFRVSDSHESVKITIWCERH